MLVGFPKCSNYNDLRSRAEALRGELLWPPHAALWSRRHSGGRRGDRQSLHVQFEIEARAPAGAALAIELRVHGLERLPDDRQAEAAPAEEVAPPIVRLLEGFEQRLLLLPVHPPAGIPHRKPES